MATSISRRQFLTGLPFAITTIAAGGMVTRAQAAGLQSLPYQAGTLGYTCYRTPSLVVTTNGTVLAFCGARLENCKDDGDHDIVVRRSLDGGRTWMPLQVIANDGMNRCDIPLPVVLPTGRVLLLWVWNTFVRRKEDRGPRRVMVCHSDDHGLTWSPPRDITQQVRRPGWKPWYGLGPGHGFVKQLAPAAGRIIVPARHGEEKIGSRSHLIYSDDGGISWEIGAQAWGPNNSSESIACELGDGKILLNSRANIGYRITTICKDGGQVTEKTFVERQLIEPMNGCQASMLTYSLNKTNRSALLLFSNPANSRFRTNGRLRLSRDNGRTWTRGYPYQRGPEAFTGYSDLARFSNGDVAILFESGASYRKGVFADAALGDNLFPGNTSKRGKQKRNGRIDNRHDGIAFTRIPITTITASS